MSWLFLYFCHSQMALKIHLRMNLKYSWETSSQERETIMCLARFNGNMAQNNKKQAGQRISILDLNTLDNKN